MAEGVLDLEALLAPLPAGDGVGEDLREDSAASSLYQQAKAHRNDARGGERAIDNDSSDANPAAIATAWREVKRLGVEALRTRSKDIEVACWVTEALIRVDGLPGLADGAALITGLCERYWDAGFPSLATEDGLEDRVIVLGGLSGGGTDGVLMTPIRRYPLFQRADGSNGDLYEWQRAEETASIADAERRQARIDAGVPDFDALQNEARASIGALRAAGQQARATLDAWTAMDAALSAKLGAEAPSTRRVADALQSILDLVTRLGGAPAEPAAEEEQAAGSADEPVAGGAAPAGGAPGPRPLRTREDALRQIEEIAAFFRKTEPHSPLAATLEDAARRARLPLTELLTEVLPDASARRMLLTALGIRVPDDYG
jgi:type VI secretion system protein ImpA